MEPSEFAFMVRGIRELEKALGDGVKTPTPCEINNAKGMKRSLVSKQKILKGTAISAEMITFKRPASGIAPREYRQTIGRIAAQDIPADTILIHAMFKQ
jgi:N,N'-diacetyllegionaminate synthase